MNVGRIGGDACLEQRLSGSGVPLAIGFEEVDPAEPVHLEVDEAGHRQPVPVRRRKTHGCDPAVDDLHVAAHEASLDERCLDAELHEL